MCSCHVTHEGESPVQREIPIKSVTMHSVTCHIRYRGETSNARIKVRRSIADCCFLECCIYTRYGRSRLLSSRSKRRESRSSSSNSRGQKSKVSSQPSILGNKVQDQIPYPSTIETEKAGSNQSTSRRTHVVYLARADPQSEAMSMYKREKRPCH